MAGALQIVNTYKRGLTGSGTFDDFAAGNGDSLTFAVYDQATRAYLAEIWAVDSSGPVTMSYTASNFHDREFGILGSSAYLVDGNSASRASLISPSGLDQPIVPGDLLSVRGADASSGDANSTFLLRYSQLPGIAAKLATWQQVEQATVNIVGVQVAVDASSGTGQGDWSAGVLLNDGGNRLDANKYYAILGFTADAPFAACGITAFETGNLRIGAPIIGDGNHDSYSIYDLSKQYNDTFIPIISGTNQGSVTVFVADPATTTGNVFVMLAQLSGPLGG